MPRKDRFVTCEICGTRASRKNDKKRMFMAKFPLDEGRCRQWVKIVGKEDLIYIPIEKLHVLKYICGDHFASKAFNKKKSRLKRSAIPTTNLKADPLPDEMLLDFPCHIFSSIPMTHDPQAICYNEDSQVSQRQIIPIANKSGCDATNETHKLFVFPRIDSLRKLWLSFLVPTNPLLIHLSKEQLVARRVCEKHFDRHQFDGEGKRIRFSYPCLFSEDEIKHGEPLPAPGTVQDALSDHNYFKDQEDDKDSTEVVLVVGLPATEELIRREHGYISNKNHIDHSYTKDGDTVIDLPSSSKAESRPDVQLLDTGDRVEADTFDNDDSPPSPDAEIGADTDTQGREEEQIFSWQRTELIETDDTGDPVPTPVSEKTKLREDPVTLSLFCEPEPQSVPCEPAAVVVPEDIEYRCKDCEAVVDGYHYWCVSCGAGALCGACAASLTHDEHFILRAPRGASKDQTQAVLAALRKQLLAENILTLYDTDEDGVKLEVKEEPDEPPMLLETATDPDPLDLPDPLPESQHLADTISEDTLTEEPMLDDSLNEEGLEESILEDTLSELSEESLTEVLTEDVSEALDESLTEALTEEHTSALSEESLNEVLEEQVLEEIPVTEEQFETEDDTDVQFVGEETLDHHPFKRPRLTEHSQRHTIPRSTQNITGHLPKQQTNVVDLKTNQMISVSDQGKSKTVPSDLRESRIVVQANPSGLGESQNVEQGTPRRESTILQVNPSNLTELETVLQVTSDRKSQPVVRMNSRELRELLRLRQTSESQIDLRELQIVASTESPIVIQVNLNELKELQTRLATPSKESETVIQINPSKLRELLYNLRQSTSSQEPNTVQTHSSNLRELQIVGKGIPSAVSQTAVHLNPNDLKELQIVRQFTPSTESQTVTEVNPDNLKGSVNVRQVTSGKVPQTPRQMNPSNLRESQPLRHITPSTESETVIETNPDNLKGSVTVRRVISGKVSQIALQANPRGLKNIQTIRQVIPGEGSQTVTQAKPSGLRESHYLAQANPSGLRKLNTVAQVNPSDIRQSHTVARANPIGLRAIQTARQVTPSDLRELLTALQVPGDLRTSKITQKYQPNILKTSLVHLENQSSKPKVTRAVIKVPLNEFLSYKVLTHENSEKNPNSPLRFQKNDPKGPKALPKVQEVSRGKFCPLKVTSEPNPVETVIINSEDNVSEDIEFLEEEYLVSDSEHGDILDKELDKDNRLHQNRTTSKDRIVDIESEINYSDDDDLDKDYRIDEDDLTDDDSVYEADENVSESGAGRRTRNATKTVVRDPWEAMKRKLTSEATVTLQPLTSLEIRKWTTDKNRRRED